MASIKASMLAGYAGWWQVLFCDRREELNNF